MYDGVRVCDQMKPCSELSRNCFQTSSNYIEPLIYYVFLSICTLYGKVKTNLLLKG